MRHDLGFSVALTLCSGSRTPQGTGLQRVADVAQDGVCQVRLLLHQSSKAGAWHKSLQMIRDVMNYQCDQILISRARFAGEAQKFNNTFSSVWIGEDLLKKSMNQLPQTQTNEHIQTMFFRKDIQSRMCKKCIRAFIKIVGLLVNRQRASMKEICQVLQEYLSTYIVPKVLISELQKCAIEYSIAGDGDRTVRR